MATIKPKTAPLLLTRTKPPGDLRNPGLDIDMVKEPGKQKKATVQQANAVDTMTSYGDYIRRKKQSQGDFAT